MNLCMEEKRNNLSLNEMNLSSAKLLQGLLLFGFALVFVNMLAMRGACDSACEENISNLLHFELYWGVKKQLDKYVSASNCTAVAYVCACVSEYVGHARCL